jgi:hypothetical protein
MAPDQDELSEGTVPAFFWGLAYVLAVFVTNALARSADLQRPWLTLSLLIPMVLLIPYVRALQRRARYKLSDSPATRTYTWRLLLAVIAYFATVEVVVTLERSLDQQSPFVWILALVPVVPVLAILWAQARYFIDEQDGYLRTRAVNAALIATGILLVFAVLWGFLETFGLVSHVPASAALPLWAVGTGLGNLFNWARE